MSEKEKLSPRDFILQYLSMFDDFQSPNSIGEAYGRYIGSTGSGMHSAWASPRCKKMVLEGALLRNFRGWYMLSRPTE